MISNACVCSTKEWVQLKNLNFKAKWQLNHNFSSMCFRQQRNRWLPKREKRKSKWVSDWCDMINKNRQNCLLIFFLVFVKANRHRKLALTKWIRVVLAWIRKSKLTQCVYRKIINLAFSFLAAHIQCSRILLLNES